MKYLDNTRTIQHKDMVINMRTEVGDSVSNEDGVFYVFTRILGIHLEGKWFNPSTVTNKVTIYSLTDIHELNDVFKTHEESIKRYADSIVTKVSNTRKTVNAIFDSYLTESEGYW